MFVWSAAGLHALLVITSTPGVHQKNESTPGRSLGNSANIVAIEPPAPSLLRATVAILLLAATPSTERPERRRTPSRLSAPAAGDDREPPCATAAALAACACVGTLMGLVAIEVGPSISVIDGAVYAMLVLMALATTFVTTPVLRRLVQRA